MHLCDLNQGAHIFKEHSTGNPKPAAPHLVLSMGCKAFSNLASLGWRAVNSTCG